LLLAVKEGDLARRLNFLAAAEPLAVVLRIVCNVLVLLD